MGVSVNGLTPGYLWDPDSLGQMVEALDLAGPVRAGGAWDKPFYGGFDPPPACRAVHDRLCSGDGLLDKPPDPARRQPGFDVTVTVHKSVSVTELLLLPPETLKARVRDIARDCVLPPILERLGRLTAGRGKEPVAVAVEAYPHMKSFLGAPHLHFHVAVYNLGVTADGRVMSLRGVKEHLFDEAKAINADVQFLLAERYKAMGVAVERDKDNCKVAAVPAALERALSPAREAIREMQAGAKAAATRGGTEWAARELREEKSKGLALFPDGEKPATMAGYRAGWERRAREKAPELTVASVGAAVRKQVADHKPPPKQVVAIYASAAAYEATAAAVRGLEKPVTARELERLAVRAAMTERRTTLDKVRTHVRIATDPKGLAAHNLEKVEVRNRHTGGRAEKFAPPEVVAAHRVRLAGRKAAREKEAADRAAKEPRPDRTWAEFGRAVQDKVAQAVKRTVARVTLTFTDRAAREPGQPGPDAGRQTAGAKGEEGGKAKGAKETAAGGKAEKAGKAGAGAKVEGAGKVDPRPPFRRTLRAGPATDWFIERHAPTPYWQAHGRALMTGLRHGSLDRAERAFKEERGYKRLKPRTVLRVEDPGGRLTDREIACLRRLAARDRATFEYAGPAEPDKQKVTPDKQQAGPGKQKAGPDRAGARPKPPPEPDLGKGR